MNRESSPPAGLTPPDIGRLPAEKRIEIWAELVEESDALLIAGLQAKVGPAGDWREAYRQWNARRMAEHDRMQIRFAENLTRREAASDK